jgi:hypothetical protein
MQNSVCIQLIGEPDSPLPLCSGALHPVTHLLESVSMVTLNLHHIGLVELGGESSVVGNSPV